MSDCKNVRSRLKELAATPRAAWPATAAGHVSRCETCARAVAAERLARGLVETAARGVEPRPGFTGRVMARVRTTGRREGADLWRPAWALLPAFGSVAVGLLALFLLSPGVALDWPGLGGGVSAGERLVIEPGPPDQDLVLAAVLENGR